MKKILLFASALAGLFLAGSCQKETLESAAQGSVTYEITLPDGPQTKGEAGYELYDLHYEVYRINGTAIDKLYHNRVDMPKEGLNLPLDLLNDQTYTVIFWAQEKGSPWIDASDLQNIQLKESVSNNDHRDAFCAVDANFSHDGAQSRKVTLTRPFAQVNIATTVNNVSYDITPKNSLVTFRNIPTGYNLLEGETNTTTEVTFGLNDIPGNTITVNGTSYTTVAMNYVLVADSNIDEVYYEIETANGTVKNAIPSVPVKKNYRTNIIGNLLTSNATYTIELKPGFEGDNGAHVEVINEGVTKNINGDYEITNVKGLAYAINNLFVDANGVANTATFYVQPGIYDMAQQAINDVTVTSGTLKVYDTEAVVTRSAPTGSVVIKGLKKAIIKEVKEDATVFFSGITITDFNGADNAAALVQNNEGKVVLAGCAIDNEEGQNTELVGGNDPVEVEKGEEEAGELIYTAEQLATAFEDESVKSIALGADITLENTLVFPEGRTATLDLRGWELTVNEPASNYAINNHGTLTIKDSYATGEVNARGIYNGFVAEGDSITDAELTIISGTFNAMGTNGGAADYNYGKAVINGGKFQSNGGYGLNSQTGAEMTVNSADVRGGIYNCGTLTVAESKVYQHLSGKHCIYNWKGSVTIESGEFDSESGNELILADGQNASVVIKGGEFHKTAKSWLYGAATGKDITFTITGGTHYGYVNEPEMTVDTFRPYGDLIVVTGGSYNFDVTKWCAKDYKAVKNAETAMWDVVEKVYVAKIGEDGYESLQEAVEAVKDGETITFVADVEQVDGIIITDKNITVDLNDKTFTVSEGASTNNRNFKINGSSVVTIKNGTMIAAGEYSSGAYGTLRTEGSAKVTLTGVKLYNYRGNGLNVKALSGTTVTITDTEIYSEYGGGVEAAGGTVELTNVKVEQNGMYTAPYNSMAISVNGGGTATVNSGTYSTVCITAEEANNQGTSHGPWCAGVLNSGGTLIIEGGTFSNDNFGDNSLATAARGLLLADTGANIQINGGTFNALKAIVDVTNNLGDASRNPSVTLAGGDFSADPRVSGLYASHLISVAEGYVVKEENGEYKVSEKPKPVAKVGNTEYGSIDEAIANWTPNSTLTLLSDVTLSDVVTLESTKHHILDLGTYTMTAAANKNAIEIVPEGNGAGTAARSCLTINADTANPGTMEAGSKACVYYKKTNGIDDRIMVTFNGGIFNGTISSSSNNGGQACPYFVFNGGVFNKSINLTKAMLKVTGGIFHGMFSCTGDSTSHRLISGGTFKSWTFMTADAANKFCVGTDKQTYNVGLYINDDGYLVVGGPVITEFGDKFAAKATNATKWSSYLQYSSAAANGLYYTNAEMAIKKHGEANVVLK